MLSGSLSIFLPMRPCFPLPLLHDQCQTLTHSLITSFDILKECETRLDAHVGTSQAAQTGSRTTDSSLMRDGIASH